MVTAAKTEEDQSDEMSSGPEGGGIGPSVPRDTHWWRYLLLKLHTRIHSTILFGLIYTYFFFLHMVILHAAYYCLPSFVQYIP